MPFQTFPKPRLPVSLILVTFRGQLLIRPAGNGRSCAVSVNYDTNVPHRLTVSLVANRPDGSVVPIIDPPLNGKLEDTFSIGATAGPKGVFKFNPTTIPAGQFFDRTLNNDDQDLRWALDLQNDREFHDFAFTFVEGQVNPGFYMTDGVFYTFDRSKPSVLLVNRHRPGDNLTLASIGTVIYATIETPATGKIEVKWKQGGTARSVQLPRDPATGDLPGTYYSISVENEPPAGIEVHDELAEYYRVLRKPDGSELPPNEKFELTTVHLNSFDGDRIPCMSVIFGG